MGRVYCDTVYLFRSGRRGRQLAVAAAGALDASLMGKSRMMME